MALDTAASNVATNQLNGIPFGKLIGEPLMAAVRAQNEAAIATANFINDVGYNINPETKKKEPIMVVFTYQTPTGLVNLVVPILAILPIPYIAVEVINIHFTANIKASGESQNTQKSELEGEVNAGASTGFWRTKANFKASVSSKKDSTATQSSKYSVEYTIDINVRAGQEGMPAGMAKVLNTITESITASGKDGNAKIKALAPGLEFKGTYDNVTKKSTYTATLPLLLLLKDGALKEIKQAEIGGKLRSNTLKLTSSENISINIEDGSGSSEITLTYKAGDTNDATKAKDFQTKAPDKITIYLDEISLDDKKIRSNEIELDVNWTHPNIPL